MFSFLSQKLFKKWALELEIVQHSIVQTEQFTL